MAHTRIVWGVSLFWLVIGLGAGLLMQIELLAPGLSGLLGSDSPDATSTYKLLSTVHMKVLAMVFPTCLVGGLGLSLMAEQNRMPEARLALQGFAYLMLIVGSAIALVGDETALRLIPRLLISITLFSTSIGLILLIFHTRRSVSAGLYLAAIILPASAYFLLKRISSNANLSLVVQDTYYSVAMSHCLATVIILAIFVLLAVWTKSRDGQLSLWVTMPHILAILFASAVYIGNQVSLGVNGMPKRYVDYPDVFSEIQIRVSIAGFVLVALIIVGFARFAFAVWRRDRSTPADEF